MRETGMQGLIVECLEVGAFAENCYILGCAATKKGVLLDTGDEASRISAKVSQLGFDIEYILLTHGHLDHVMAVATLQGELDVPVLMNKGDAFLLENLPAQAAAFGLSVSGIPRVDTYIKEGDTIEFGALKFDVLLTPGHSPGSVAFAGTGAVFSGDVLFAGSIGRTDLPGGDYDTLIRSIRDKLLALGDGVVVYPGHGPATTVGHERLRNPFLREG